jgi:raffinose/stachyose/melibiose transport system substrate-binding protein
MRKLGTLLLVGVLLAALTVGCGNNNAGGGKNAAGGGNAGGGGKVNIEFFQNKSEAKATFDKLIQQFNDANPNIVVKQLNPPDAETVLKTRVSKKDVPDVVGIGATDTFAALTKAGTFVDMTGDALLESIQPAYLQMVKDMTGSTEMNGIPFAANANGIIYNKQLFQDLGLTVPGTWDELMATAKKVQDAGKIPFYFTLKDSWTDLPAFNALASNLQPEGFIENRLAGKTTFKEGYRDIAEKYGELMKYGHKDNFGKGYADGNTAFAKGESVMYLQGVWAIPEIKKANPDIQLGTFAFPATNDPANNKLISGVDTLLAISKTTKHQEEAKKFVEFLLKPENVQTYINEQKAFSAVKGVTQDDPTVAELKPYFDKGMLVDFADHYFPAAMKLDKINQEYLKKLDVDTYLKMLDTEWDKVQSRK